MQFGPGPEVLPEPHADIHPPREIAPGPEAVHAERLRHRAGRSEIHPACYHLRDGDGLRGFPVKNHVEGLLPELAGGRPGEPGTSGPVEHFNLDGVRGSGNLVGGNRSRRRLRSGRPQNDRRDARRGEQDSGPAQRDPAGEGVTREFQKRTVGSGNDQPD